MGGSLDDATYDPLFQASGQQYNVDPLMLKAQAIVESGLNRNATSNKGARGISQFMPATAAAYGIDPTKPEQAIPAQAAMMSKGLEDYGNPTAALMAYHGGPDQTQWGPLTQAYPAKVKQVYAALKARNSTAAPAGMDADEAAGRALAAGAHSSAASVAMDPDEALGRSLAAPAQAPAPEPATAPQSTTPADPKLQAALATPTGVFGHSTLGDDIGHGPNILPVAANAAAEAFGTAPVSYNPLDTVPRVLGAGLAGVQGAVRQAFENRGMPLLGRDVAALPEAYAGGEAAMEAGPLAIRRSSLGAQPANRLAATTVDRAAPVADSLAPQSEPATANALGGPAPEPQSVGAAASAADDRASNMSPAETQAYRSMAEIQKLLEPQPIGKDLNAYVPGVNPTMAETEQSANISREQKMLESQIPEDAKRVSKENNEARQQHFASIAGSPVDVMNAEAARSAQATADLSSAFGDKKPVDAQPVADTISGILSAPRAINNSALQKYVAPLLESLKADGGLVSDPEQLYGLREEVNRMMSKASQAETPTLSHVTGQLSDIKDALDGVIEQGAPGYKQYLQNYAEASRPIDTMTALQSYEPKLYDSQGRMQLSRVQKMMSDVVTSRAAPGVNPYKSIPDETVGQLFNLRDDLRRAASADELAKAKGSDTAANLLDYAKAGAKYTGLAVAHGAANYAAPGVGSLAINALGQGIKARSTMKANAAMQARANALIRPPPNRLTPIDGP